MRFECLASFDIDRLESTMNLRNENQIDFIRKTERKSFSRSFYLPGKLVKKVFSTGVLVGLFAKH
jgi:hypothetical protein